MQVLYQQATLDLLEVQRSPAATADLLRSVERAAQRMNKDARVDGEPHARMLLCGLAAARGDLRAAGSQLDAALTGYRAAGMTLPALCAQRRALELRGEDPGELDERFHAFGVADPELWTRCQTPVVLFHRPA